MLTMDATDRDMKIQLIGRPEKYATIDRLSKELIFA